MHILRTRRQQAAMATPTITRSKLNLMPSERTCHALRWLITLQQLSN